MGNSLNTSSISVAKQAALDRRPLELPLRRPGLAPTPDEDPLYYAFDDAVISLFVTAISAGIPELEKHFIHSMRNFQDQIKDPKLLKEVKGFIGQEGHHSNEHRTINRFFSDAGLDLNAVEAHMKRVMTSWKLNASPKQQLAYTVCAEHLTGLAADFGLRKRTDLMDQVSNETMREMWAWHLIEEAEHKSVAYDLYEATVNEPLRLRLTMLYVTSFALSFSAINTWRLMRQTGESTNVRSILKGAGFLFGRRGMITSMVRDYLDFYRPGFHPWDHDNRPEIEGWKARFFAGKYSPNNP